MNAKAIAIVQAALESCESYEYDGSIKVQKALKALDTIRESDKEIAAHKAYIAELEHSLLIARAEIKGVERLFENLNEKYTRLKPKTTNEPS